MPNFFKELIFHIIPHAFEDTVLILPFLFLTYVFMEYIEHKTEDKFVLFIKNSGKVGPLIGSAVGIVPQCGFSAMASSLYSGRVITLGTLIAVFLSTSDEMLPIMLSRQVPIKNIIVLLLTKLIIGMISGFIVDIIFRTRHEPEDICVEEMCDHENCQCEKGILPSAIKHTVSVYAFIFVITLALDAIIHYIGEDALASFVIARPVVGQLLCGIIGIIPNCAASVVVTELFINGIISAGAMMSGLLVGAGVGLLILFRTNKHLKENFKIIGLLYIFGVIFGVILDILNFGALLS